jgi:outer membrane protein OmpA-like peptidoglycan-associated protein
VRPPPAPVAPAGSVATAPSAAALALPAPPAERTPLVNRVAEARILFDSGDAVLTPDAAAVVNALAPELAASGRTIVIVGHADASGPAGLNDYLSRERAEAVKEALVARGVPAPRIRAFGVGSGVPATEQDTDAGRTASRRVEMYLR